MSLPKTIEDVVKLCGAEVESMCATAHLRDAPNDIVITVAFALGLKLDDDGKTLIYPSTTGTNTPRYQVPEQRNVRFRGGRKK